MTLQERISALITAIGADVKALYGRAIPSGGASGQVLRKNSGTNYDVSWYSLRDGYQTLTDGATVTWNLDNGTVGQVTLGGNRTLSITNPRTPDFGTLWVIQDGTGGRTLTLPSGSRVQGAGATTAITLSAAPGAIDIISFAYNGSYYAWTIGRGY